MIFALCSLSRGIRYPRYTWILRIRRCPLAAGELPNLQALCFDKHTTSAGDAWVPLNRQKEKRETMNTPIPDVEILPPEAPSATTAAGSSAIRLPLPASLSQWHPMPSPRVGISVGSLLPPFPPERRRTPFGPQRLRRPLQILLRGRPARIPHRPPPSGNQGARIPSPRRGSRLHHEPAPAFSLRCRKGIGQGIGQGAANHLRPPSSQTRLRKRDERERPHVYKVSQNTRPYYVGCRSPTAAFLSSCASTYNLKLTTYNFRRLVSGRPSVAASYPQCHNSFLRGTRTLWHVSQVTSHVFTV